MMHGPLNVKRIYVYLILFPPPKNKKLRKVFKQLLIDKNFLPFLTKRSV